MTQSEIIGPTSFVCSTHTHMYLSMYVLDNNSGNAFDSPSCREISFGVREIRSLDFSLYTMCRNSHERPKCRRCRKRPSRKSLSIAESHAPEIFADEFVMLSRKIQKPHWQPPSIPPPVHPVYPGSPCIDFCPMEYRDTRPLTTLSLRSSPSPIASLCDSFLPPFPFALTDRSLTQYPSLASSLVLVSRVPCIAIFNTVHTCEAKVDILGEMDHYSVMPVFPSLVRALFFSIFQVISYDQNACR